MMNSSDVCAKMLVRVLCAQTARYMFVAFSAEFKNSHDDPDSNVMPQEMGESGIEERLFVLRNKVREGQMFLSSRETIRRGQRGLMVHLNLRWLSVSSLSRS